MPNARNPWLGIPLADYEAHMSSPMVAQAVLLAEILHEVVRTGSARSVAVLGSAGGNGFDRLSELGVQRLIAVDINAEYLRCCEERYAERFPVFEPVLCDLSLGPPFTQDVDLVYAALVLEYIDVKRFTDYAPLLLREGGTLACVFQMPGSAKNFVSRTGIDSLCPLEEMHRYISVEEFIGALARKFSLEERRLVPSAAGREFTLVALKRR